MPARGAAFLGQVPAELPVGDIGEADDAPAAHAEHLGQHPLHVQHGLQRLRKDDEIELPVGEGRQAAVQVPLHYVQPAANTGHDGLFIQFDAHGRAAAAAAEPGQQPARAAAQVQHAGPRGTSSTIES